MTPVQQLAACERTFRRHGLSLLVHGHSSRCDVFGRAAPFLLVVLLLEVIGAIKLDWSVWVNVAVLVGAMVALSAGYVGLNVARRRSWSILPQDIGRPELAFFVLAPAILPVRSGGQWRTGLAIAVGNVVLLGLVRVVGYRLAATLWRSLSRVGTELGSSLLRLIRFLPLLLIFSIALFYTTEVWQVFDHSPGTSDVILGVFFTLAILAILRIRLRTETREILARARRETPDAEDLPPLTRAQLANVAAMVGSNQLLQVVVVSLGVGAFFLALGVLTITPGVMEAWQVTGGGWREQVALFDDTLVVTQTLIRVATAMAMFTGLYYAISVLTDAVYRTEFIDDLAAKMVDVTAHRVRYQRLLAGSASLEVGGAAGLVPEHT